MSVAALMRRCVLHFRHVAAVECYIVSLLAYLPVIF